MVRGEYGKCCIAKCKREIHPSGMICMLVAVWLSYLQLVIYHIHIFTVCVNLQLNLMEVCFCICVCMCGRGWGGCMQFWPQPGFPWQRQDKGIIDDTLTPLHFHSACSTPYRLTFTALSLVDLHIYVNKRHTDPGNMHVCVLCSMKDIQYLPLLWKSLMNCVRGTLCESSWGRKTCIVLLEINWASL